jgi:drug/metabolite transporter (DMT)-like permease
MDFNRGIGIAMALGSSLAMSVGLLLLNILKDDFQVLQLVTLRSAMVTIIALPLALIKREPVFRFEWKLCFSGFMMWAIVLSFIAAILTLGYADASAIFFAQSVFVGVFACIFLREPCKAVQVIVTFLMILGVVLVVQPPGLFSFFRHDNNGNATNISKTIIANTHLVRNATEGNIPFEHKISNGSSESRDINNSTSRSGHFIIPRWQGTLLALTACLISSVFLIYSKNFKDVHFTTLLIQYNSMTCLLTLPLTLIFWQMRCPSIALPWITFLGSAVSICIAHSLLYLSLAREKAEVISVVRTSQVALAYLLEITFTGVFPTWSSISGATLITITAVLYGVWKMKTVNERKYQKIEEDDEEESELERLSSTDE